MKTNCVDHRAPKPPHTPPSRIGRLMRAGAVLATFWLLLAESPPPICEDGLGAQAFTVTGDCGPPGLVVVSVDDYDRVTVQNPSRLGFTEDSASGRLLNDSCPSSVRQAHFEVWGEARGYGRPPAADAGAELDAGAFTDAGAESRDNDRDAGEPLGWTSRLYRTCSVAREGEALVATCTGMGPSCRATLKPLEVP